MALSISKTDIRSVMKFIAVFLIIILAINIPILIKNYNDSQIYEAALQELEQGNYAAAEQKFAEVASYHDAQALSVYCRYVQLYANTQALDLYYGYGGGFDAIAAINLKYEKHLQAYVDLLQRQLNRYKLQKEADDKAAALAAKETELKEKYSGKLPVEGMPMSALKYTTLGEPKIKANTHLSDKSCKAINVYWYDEHWEKIASGTCYQLKDDDEIKLYEFDYPQGSTVNTNPAPTTYPNNSGRLRDDYGDPEDLWEEDKGFWYEDEDEAWDEWEDD